MTVTANKPLDLGLLMQQLAAAGITVAALGTAGAVVHTYRADGQPLDLPPAAQAVVDAHDYTQGTAERLRSGDAAALDAFRLGWLLGQARLGRVAANGIQRQMDTIEAANISTVAIAATHIKTLAEAVEDIAGQLQTLKRTVAIQAEVPDR